MRSMFSTSTRIGTFLLAGLLLSACADYGRDSSFQRDTDAAIAKVKMVGMSNEDVLGCMGPPKKKAKEGATEVWSYPSTDGRHYSSRNRYGTGSGSRGDGWSFLTAGGASRGSSEKRFCTVNVVMKNSVVTAVHYLGPAATGDDNRYDQCGYAVAACADEQR